MTLIKILQRNIMYFSMILNSAKPFVVHEEEARCHVSNIVIIMCKDDEVYFMYIVMFVAFIG